MNNNQNTNLAPVQNPNAQTQMVQNNTVTSKSQDLLAPLRNFGRTIFKIILTIVSLTLTFGIVYSIIFFTNLDLQIINLSFSGRVVSGASKTPVEKAQIFIDGTQMAETDAQGRFSISKITAGNKKVKVVATTFPELEEEVSINKSFLKYNVYKEFTLNAEEVKTGNSTLSGKFVNFGTNHLFINDKLLVGTKQYPITKEGTFEITSLPIGKITFEYQSSDFKDIKQEVEISEGKNVIKDISVAPAADIVGDLKNYVTDQIISDPKIEVSGITAEQILINNTTGKFQIKDLDVSKEYTLRFSATNIQSRDYKITVAMGDNTIPNLNFVNDVKQFYVAKASTDKSYYLYSSDLDGNGAKKIVDILNTNVSNLYADSSNLYYTSDQDKITSKYKSGKVNLIYRYSFIDQKIEKITKNTTNLGAIVPNYIAQKALNVFYQKEGNNIQTKIQIISLDGATRSFEHTLKQGESIFSIRLTNDASKIYMVTTTNKELPVLKEIDIASKNVKEINQRTNLTLFDTSSDSKRAIFSSKDPTASYINLYLYDSSTSETRKLITNFNGSDAQFVKDSNDEIIYYKNFNKEPSVNKFKIAENSEETLFTLETGDEIKGLYQQNKSIHYYTKKSLYSFDLQFPKAYKKVLDGLFLK